MVRSVPVLVCGAALTLLAGCAVGPDYLRPQAVAEMPADFKELAGWKVAEPGHNALPAKWWELYRDPQLNQLEEQVVVSNQTIRQAEAQFRQAQALAQAARAGYFPSLTAGASAVRSQRSANAPGATKTTPESPSWDLQLPLDLSWEIDLWGKIRRSVEASEAASAASADDLAGVRLSMQAALAASYFQLRALDAQKSLFDETVANYRRYLELTKNRYQSGVAAKADLLQAETQLKGTEAQALDLDVQRAQLEHAIALLVGQPASSFSLPRLPLSEPPPMIPLTVPSALLERRPDIAAAERRMAAANAQIGVAKAAYFPRLSLTASAGYEAARAVDWLTWPSRFWSVGPAVSELLFDGGLRQAQSEEARAAFDATVAAYRQTVLAGFQEVEDNLAALRILETESTVQEAAVQAAQQTTAITTNQYRAGTVSSLNVIVAQATELANRRTALTILGRRLVASVQLVKALGGGWRPDGAAEEKEGEAAGP